MSAPWLESGITATTTGNWLHGGTHLTTINELAPVTFTFAGNAFGGNFAVTGATDAVLSFTVDGSQSRDLSVTHRSLGYTFLGYISNSSSNISVTVSPSSDSLVVDSFTRANGTNPSNPGSNVAPEPGSFALALTGVIAGLALLYIGIAAAQGYVQANYGLYLPLAWPSEYEWTLLGGILAAALLMGSVPAWRAYRQSLADGLSIRL